MISSGITSVGCVSSGQVGPINPQSPWSWAGLCLCPALSLACPTSPYWWEFLAWFWTWLFTTDFLGGCGPTLVAATRLAVCALGLPWTAPLLVRVLSPLGAITRGRQWRSPLLLLPNLSYIQVIVLWLLSWATESWLQFTLPSLTQRLQK